MTSEQLIAEGRKLDRSSVFLRSKGSGPVAAIWYRQDEEEIESTGHHCWLTVDARHMPGLSPSIAGFISLYTNEESYEGGQVEVTPDWPKREGTRLFDHPASVLPPIDAVFFRGSESVGEWLQENNWQQDWHYNDNFKDKQVTKDYYRIFTDEYPLYIESDIFAMLGGWHMPFPDPDWSELIDDQLMIMTIRDSEPWVEAWRTRTGDFKVIQRIT